METTVIVNKFKLELFFIFFDNLNYDYEKI